MNLINDVEQTRNDIKDRICNIFTKKHKKILAKAYYDIFKDFNYKSEELFKEISKKLSVSSRTVKRWIKK